MKKITLNAEKRNSIANVIETHFRNANSKLKVNWLLAKNKFNDHKETMHELAHIAIRQHQPQEDIDTIKSMVSKYGDNGGKIYNDKCFYFETNYIDEADGKPRTKDIHLDFGLSYNFALSYFDDELREQGLDPDNEYKYKETKNPHYHSMYDRNRKYLGMHHNEQIKKGENIEDNWNDKYKIEVIGSQYCGSRQFKVDNETFEILNRFQIMQEKVVSTHEQFYDYIKSKMDKVRLGLKSYKYFDEAKELCDKLGIALNETILDTESSLALSIYNPSALASLLQDNESEDNKADIIAQFKQGKLNQAIN
jgi:hypothetical protein